MSNPRRCFCYSLLFVALFITFLQTGRLRQVQQLYRTSKTISNIYNMNLSQSATSLKDTIHFPHSGAVRESVLTAPWVPILQTTLHNMSSKRLNIVVSDGKFKSVLLNWLVASLVKLPHPLENIVIIALDSDLHTLLEERGIISVYIDPKTVVSTNLKKKGLLYHIWITRLTVYRLVSHWGYDIAMFDTDAILLQNPTDLFDSYGDVDIVGSAGTYPFPLGKKWGLTLCMGVVLFRHTHRTELLWEVLADTKTNSLDDQVKMNHALEDCDIHWSATDVQDKAVLGACAQNKLGGLKVVILPHSVVCRKTVCSMSASILHPNSRKESTAKMRAAKTQGVWYLRKDWALISNNTAQLTGAMWLRQIAV